MLLIYGIITAAAALAALLFLKERPPTPPDRAEYNPAPFSTGLKRILSLKDMRITLVLFFIGLGIFNAVSSMVDSISGFLGVQDSDGLICVLMLAGGVVGAFDLVPTTGWICWVAFCRSRASCLLISSWPARSRRTLASAYFPMIMRRMNPPLFGTCRSQRWVSAGTSKN